MAGSCMGNGQLGPTWRRKCLQAGGAKGRTTRLSGLTDGCSPSPREGLARLCWPGE